MGRILGFGAVALLVLTILSLAVPGGGGSLVMLFVNTATSAGWLLAILAFAVWCDLKHRQSARAEQRRSAAFSRLHVERANRMHLPRRLFRQ